MSSLKSKQFYLYVTLLLPTTYIINNIKGLKDDGLIIYGFAYSIQQSSTAHPRYELNLLIVNNKYKLILTSRIDLLLIIHNITGPILYI